LIVRDYVKITRRYKYLFNMKPYTKEAKYAEKYKCKLGKRN